MAQGPSGTTYLALSLSLGIYLDQMSQGQLEALMAMPMPHRCYSSVILFLSRDEVFSASTSFTLCLIHLHFALGYLSSHLGVQFLPYSMLSISLLWVQSPLYSGPSSSPILGSVPALLWTQLLLGLSPPLFGTSIPIPDSSTQTASPIKQKKSGKHLN